MATLLSDNFDRANNTTTVGPPQIGPSPTVHTGVGGISSNNLYTPTQPCVISYDLATVNVEMSFTYATTPVSAACSILLAVTDANNYYQVHFNSTGVSLIHTTGGNANTLYASTVAIPALGSVCRAHYRDGVIRAYVSGTLVIRWAVDAIPTATRHGFRSVSTAMRVDDLLGTDAPTVSEPTLTGDMRDPTTGMSGAEKLEPGFVYRGRDTKGQDESQGA